MNLDLRVISEFDPSCRLGVRITIRIRPISLSLCSSGHGVGIGGVSRREKGREREKRAERRGERVDVCALK
jgi:hypothetical protein